MVIQLSEALYTDFLQELEAASVKTETDTERLAVFIRVCRDYLHRIRELVLAEGFADTAQEIEFFKAVKPKFIQPLIREQAVCQLMANKPKGSTETVMAYYEAELKQLSRFFDSNRFQYEYYRQGMVEMDHLFFVRGAEPSPSHYYGIPPFDPDFSTAMDFLFAKFSAYEALQEIIVDQIGRLMNPIATGFVDRQDAPGAYGLNWTGESINLVELAYGIWLTGQLNHGNATVSEIVRWLEGSLDIRIGRAYRRWTEISRRDRVHSTKYIDRMREAIIIRLQNEDDAQRKKRQSRKNR